MKLNLYFIAATLALCALLPYCLWAQPKNNYLKDVNLPSPNAAALGKYGDIPVSYFTGVPNISIPIHTLQEGPLSLSVSLNYHASGLKVAETASWVGAGWSLDAGGMISRTVLGLRDETASVGYFAYGSNLTYTPSNELEAARGNIDSEPDVFNFNIMGYSGKFFYDPKATTTNKWTTVPKQDIVIEHDPISLDFFKITTPDGVIYTFGALEISNPGTIRTGWYLTKIESPDKKYVINLNYEPENFAYRSLASTAYYVAGMESPSSGFCSDPVYRDPSPLLFNNNKYYNIEIRSYRLTSISTSTETLQFNAITSRDDLEPYLLTTPKRLDTIKLKAGTNSCKNWVFGYDYFVDPSCSDPHCKKLKLLQLTERSCGNTNILAKEPYKFDYEGALVMVNGQNKQILPNRLSKAIDHWGYSNGATGNDLLRVSVPTTTLYNDILGAVTFGNANRNTHEASMFQGVLKKITYPTGGNTVFTFEANEGTESKPVTSKEYLIPLTTNCTDLNLCCTNPQKIFTKTFTSAELVNPGTGSVDLSKIFFTLEMVDMECTNNPNCLSVPRSVMIEVRNNTTDAFLGRYNYNLGATEYEASRTENIKKLYSGFAPNVSYKFILCAAGGEGSFSVFKPTTTTQNVITKVGGLRIKEIRSHDGISASNDVVKTYQYLDESTNQSSGKLLIETPQYGYSLFTTDGTQKQYLCYFQDASVVPLGDYSGYHIGYQRVVETLPGNGKNVYLYQTETFTPSYGFPIVPDPATVQRGQILMSSTYHENAQTLEQTVNLPASDTYVETSATVFKAFLTNTCNGAFFTTSQTYKPRTAPYRLATQTITRDGVSNFTTYGYASSGHLASIVITTTNSNNKTSLQSIYYAQEMSARSASPVYAAMVSRNMITIPIEQTELIALTTVKGSRTDYSFFDLNGNSTSTSSPGIYPHKFWNYEMTWDINNKVPTSPAPGWVLKGTIDSYHPDIKPATTTTTNPARAYPKQFTQAGWSPETYEWENGLLTQKTYLQHTQSFQYYPNTRLLWTSISVDGQVSTYFYDNLWRLKTVSSRNNKVVTNYTYGYKNTSNTYNSVKSLTTYTPVTGSNFKEKGMVQYFDGLGRLVQDLKLKHQPKDGSNDQMLPTNDVAVTYQYDTQGRLRSTSNPYLSTKQDGSFVAVPANWPSVSLQYEPSPLGRVSSAISQLGYVTQTSYGRNLSAITAPDGTSYYANSLYETKVTDPDNRVSITYTDKRGRVILSRKTNTSNTSPADTYTVYDNKDRISEVYPPSSSSSTPELIFRYRYDKADNLTYKKVPDAAAIKMTYDSRDLLVYMQDGNLLGQNRSIASSYDLYGRVVKTGFVDNFPTNFPANISDANLLTKTSYDGVGTGANLTDPQYKGRVRRSEVKVLDGASTPVWLHTSYEYDAHGRLINTVGNNYLNPNNISAETTHSDYDYGDNVYYENRNHSPAGVATPAVLLQNSYVVDANGRRNGIILNANGTAIQIAEYNYNFRDELIERNLHSNAINNAWSWLQSVDYSYNTQGWLTGINQWFTTPNPTKVETTCIPTMPNIVPTPSRSTFNEDSDVFFMHILYDQTFPGVAGSIQKNGNIAQIAYRVRGRETHQLSYTYDHLSRLTSSTFYEYSDAAVTSNTNKYNESLSYDLRGNILTLQRNGAYSNSLVSCGNGQLIN